MITKSLLFQRVFFLLFFYFVFLVRELFMMNLMGNFSALA